MGVISKIEWTDATWNVAIGCTKVSPGCKFCYMMRDMGGRFKKDVNGTVTRTSKQTFNQPLKWQKKGITSGDGSPLKVFTSSLTDVWHESIDTYRNEIWDIIEQCPDLIFQVLTKRAERIADHIPSCGLPYNVWTGVSVESQEQIERAKILCETLGLTTRFLSLEPLIGPVDLSYVFKYYPGKINWVIVGGESGNETGKFSYRKSEYEWYLDIIECCDKYNIPVFLKQVGTHLAKKWHYQDKHGRDRNEWPAILDRRDFPHQKMF